MDYSFKEGLFDFSFDIDISSYRRMTTVYFAFTDAGEYSRYMSSDYAWCKVGMHVVDSGRPEYIEQQVDARASQCAKGSPFYECPCYLVVPGYIKKNSIDNIIREVIHPAVSSILDPIYNGDYTIKQQVARLKNDGVSESEIRNSHATEIAFHIRKFEIGIIFSLIYNRIYGFPLPKWIETDFQDVLSVHIIKAVDRIAVLSDEALYAEEEKNRDNTSVSSDELISTNVSKYIYFHDVETYKLLLDVRVDSTDDVVIISTNPTDARMIVESMDGCPSSVTVIYTENVECHDGEIEEVLMTRDVLNRYARKGTYVIANIVSNGNQTIRTLSKALSLMNPTSGRIAFICDESLTHSQEVPVTYYDSMLNECIRNVCIGGKRMTRESADIFAKLSGHITDVRLDNLNWQYGTRSMRSWLTVHADMRKCNITEFPFICHGTERTATCLRECTTFGHTAEFREIIKKVLQRYNTTLDKVIMMKRHFISGRTSGHCLSYKSISGSPVKNISTSYSKTEIYGMPTWIMDSLYSTYHPFIKTVREVCSDNSVPGRSLFIHGTLDQLKNYMHNANETKLMRFIAVMNSFQTRPILNAESIPFIADRMYTDDELMLEVGINRREQSVIDEVLNMTRIGSPFVQMMETGLVDENPYVKVALF